MRWLPLVMLLAVLTGCVSPKGTPLQEDLGADVTPVAKLEVEGGVALLGTRPSGEWVIGASRGEKPETVVVPEPGEPGRPLYHVVAKTAVVVGKAPVGAAQYELVNENREVLKGKVQKGVYLIAWPVGAESPAFILRILDSKGNEIYRWPPPGGLPAA